MVSNPLLSFASMLRHLGPKPSGLGVMKTSKIDPTPIEAARKSARWCWAAGCEALARSQGVAIPQEWFVEKAFEAIAIWPSGDLRAIAEALTGEFETKDDESVRLSAAYHLGLPDDPRGMIRSIEEGRPFLFAWRGHAYVCHGLRYVVSPLQVVELLLLDPTSGFGSPEHATFSVYRDDASAIHGTLELLVKRERLAPARFTPNRTSAAS